MRIVISGCTGFIGREIVPMLNSCGADLLLLGREPDRIAQLFPAARCGSYSDLAALGRDYDAFLHLAVLNNDSDCSSSEFFLVNSDLTLALANTAAQVGIATFFNVSSFHALDEGNMGSYADSKRQATAELQKLKNINVVTVYMPAVYGRRWSGRLAKLNYLPLAIAKPLFRAFCALKPSVNVTRLNDLVVDPHEYTGHSEILLSDSQDENSIYKVTKRLVDLTFATSIVVLLWWLLLLCWIAVKMETGSPGIFSQQRVGQFGQLFTCYKFRTMRQSTAQLGTHEISATAVTRVGQFLRKTKLDELPQIWNIFRNELSLVGPRPCLSVQTELLLERSKRDVLSLKPGITGLAQVNDVDMSIPSKLAFWDARYGAMRSIILDLSIVIATFTGRGRGDRVRVE